eukprot:Gb_41099 [translate_table: standard]
MWIFWDVKEVAWSTAHAVMDSDPQNFLLRDMWGRGNMSSVVSTGVQALDVSLQKPGGIIALLDEACMFPKSTHETFAQKLYQTFKNHKRFSKPKLSRTDFNIAHYAGDVTYQADLFLDKNKDYVVAEHQDLLNASKCSFVASLFPPLPEESSKSSKFSSIGTRFKQQLQSLMETLSSTEPHYIRCVKPNNLLKPSIFENFNIIQQLRCGGVLEAIRISCAGYPTRRTFDEFLDRFGFLAPEVLEGNYDEKTACEKILDKKGLKGYQDRNGTNTNRGLLHNLPNGPNLKKRLRLLGLYESRLEMQSIGKTKIFLRAGQMAELDARRAEDTPLRPSGSHTPWRDYRYNTEVNSQPSRQPAVRPLGQKGGWVASSSVLSSHPEGERLEGEGDLMWGGPLPPPHWPSLALRSVPGPLSIASPCCLLSFSGDLYIGHYLSGQLSSLDVRAPPEFSWPGSKSIRGTTKRCLTVSSFQHTGNLTIWRLIFCSLDPVGCLSEPIFDLAPSEPSSSIEFKLYTNEIRLEFPFEKFQDIVPRNVVQRTMPCGWISMIPSPPLALGSSKCPSKLACKLYQQMKREAAAVKIQKHARRHQAWKAYTQLRSSAIVVQAALRAMASRNEFRFRKQTKAAIIIQAQWRGYRANAYYKNLKRAAIVFQCAWRGRVGRRELRKLKMAAKETGALKEAKDKLEKRVEELTWRLQLEKRLRTDLEEAKAQDIAKLQSSLQAMQAQVEEANAMLAKEREAAKKAIEEAPPVIKETPVVVVDTAKVDMLTNENEELKAPPEASVKSQEKRADEAESKYAEAQKVSEERLKKVEEAESKIDQLQDSLQRLEEKLSNLESENQVLRQQALVMSPTKGLSGRFKTTVIQRTPENGHFLNGELKATADLHSAVPVLKELAEVEQKPQKSLNDRQQENQDALIKCVMQDVGFSGGRPVAACIIYKSLLQWRSFEAERTSVFDRIIQMIGSAIESCLCRGCDAILDELLITTQENNDVLAYWLSNASTLLLLLQRTLKASGAAGMTPQRRRSSSATLFGRMAQGFRTSPSGTGLSFGNGGMIGGLDALRQVEAKYPALLFKQQLTAYVEKIYGMIRDNLKKEISPLLGLCIQAPRTSRASLVKGSSRSHANAAAQQALISHWQSIVKSLSSFLKTLRANYVPPFLVRKVFTQIFSFINVQLFNSLLLRRECCSFSNGEYVKAGLAELEHWCYEATEEYAGSAWDELKHIRQAVGFLVIHQKPKKSLDEITHDLCPVLSIQQLYRISTMYWDDKYGTHSVSPDVIANMRVLMTEDSNNALSNSFLLDDDSSIPFSVDDISKSMKQIDLSDVDPPPLIRENSAFNFLLPRAE